ncbi:Uncharacterised protein [Mycobacterium tuberculosis]|uniref:Uncharacterized protein n=1 Tax=Mycobacterium tuberculosis TaxID=1773 RepID=A0A655J1W2_MYCTX|nr:Uncharacterised protein [Mycobacterium tuberculosis]
MTRQGRSAAFDAEPDTAFGVALDDGVSRLLQMRKMRRLQRACQNTEPRMDLPNLAGSEG